MVTKNKVETLPVKEKWILKLLSFRRGVDVKELAVVTRQLATMIDAGLPLVQSLQILAEQQRNKRFAKALWDVKNRVEAGSTLNEALGRHKEIFEPLYTNLVSAGESAGVLDVVLNRLATYMEKAHALKKKVKGALSYPLVILGVTVGVVIVILTFVIPKFEAVYGEFKQALPAPTAFFVRASEIVRGNLLLVLLVMTGFMVGGRFALKVPKIRYQFDRYILKLPVFGPLLVKVSIARFSRTLGTLMSSGVPILDALGICSRSASNSFLEKIIMEARSDISQGKTIAEPFQKHKVFPAMVVQMISVGESTGKLDQMLNKIADFFEEEVDTTVATLTSLLEPIMIVVLGGVVTGTLIAMYLPIFKIAGVLM
ncbi:MAG: type II secretion system F family protein [Deltaproteobacteria bacterium]|nr:type II secretion system F family protein [Deltaproteobacteria bacterium]